MAEGTGSGGAALAAQQSIAANIPYKNIEQGKDIVTSFMTASKIASDVNSTKQRLEMALMKQDSDAKYREMEFNRKLFAMDFDQKLATMKYGKDIAALEGKLYYQGAAMDMKDRIQNWKELKDIEAMQGIGDLASYYSTIKVGDPGFTTKVYDGISKNSRGANTPAGRQMSQSKFREYNDWARNTVDKWNTDRDYFFKVEVPSELGKFKEGQVNPLYNIDEWKEQVIDKKTGQHIDIDPATGKYPAGTQPEKTGKVFYDMGPTKPPDAINPNPPHDYRTLDAKRLKQLRGKLEDITKRGNTLPQQVQNEYVTPNPAGTSGSFSMRDRALSIKNNPNSSPKAIQAAEEYLNKNPQ